jgi:hypothetical protein
VHFERPSRAGEYCSCLTRQQSPYRSPGVLPQWRLNWSSIARRKSSALGRVSAGDESGAVQHCLRIRLRGLFFAAGCSDH